MNSRKFCRQRFGAAGLAALLLAIVLLFCQAHPAVQIEPAAAAGPRSVAVCGTPFGVKMFSDGALVVAFADRYSASGRENPAKEAGLRLGDLIISAAGRPVHSNDDLSAALQTGQGSAVTILYRRGGHEYTAQLTPWADASGVYKAGLWVRDSSAGIGTLTFVDPVAGTFAGLGHPISDVDTGADFTLLSGEIVPVTVTGVRSASSGTAGELRGEFLSGHSRHRDGQRCHRPVWPLDRPGTKCRDDAAHRRAGRGTHRRCRAVDDPLGPHRPTLHRAH